MTIDNARIRIKYRDLEVEYEGAQTFLHDGLTDLVKEATEIYDAITPPVAAQPSTHSGGSKEESTIELAMGSVAAKLNAQSGPDLVIAAAAYLTLVKGETRLNRRDLINAMRDAPAYFKESMVGNLSVILASLVKGGRLNEISKEIYALTASEIDTARAALAK
ncbi:MAG: hypothetical protein GC155_01890 [Alphaproteobacteria bacterium]|nr:hypothetical protein [Alphaproteobacteria bacterium]